MLSEARLRWSMPAATWQRNMPMILLGTRASQASANSNGFQYTGRENEGNGLYFYRVRYYSPVLGRFVNEDPAGEGQNFYADNDPIQFSDLLGLWSWLSNLL
jgi:RHS repeat-associated protein